MAAKNRTRAVDALPLAALAIVITAPTSPAQSLPGGTLAPESIPKYQDQMVIPPAMPLTSVLGGTTDYYEIAVRQFEQQILPAPLPVTTVWSYGSLEAPGTVAEGGSFFYPSFTIEAQHERAVQVKWINDLVDAAGNYLPHLLPIDQTVHWANPPGPRDTRGLSPVTYTGPVPIVTHLHGGHTREESDGYPEAWYLPAAANIPGGYFRTGTFYDEFKLSSPLGNQWGDGFAIFEYLNDQEATTLWFHDHSLGMTRTNVYAGPAGFYLLRGGPNDLPPGPLPGPAPSRAEGLALGSARALDGPNAPPVYHEIPIVIQDRSFNDDGSLFYPADRAFFEGLDPAQLQIPFIPENTLSGAPSDISPIWNPEFFGNTMVVNGRTWPYLEVERRRYRLRFLNGCNSRFLILRFGNNLRFWQVGADGGFLPQPVQLNRLLLGPAERADVVVDFSGLPAGTELELLNLGPDEPFGGGVPNVDFAAADPGTTGKVMAFRIFERVGPDNSTRPQDLNLPAHTPLPAAQNTRQVSLNEEESATVFVSTDAQGNVVEDPNGVPFAPKAALLGTVDALGAGNPLLWSSAITENPALNSTEIWEIYNFTVDAHPIHVHLVQFEIVNREDQVTGAVRGPEPWETGFKDTVIVYPGEIARFRARFDVAGLFVWHCHILEHEDNEMMRPYRIGGDVGTLVCAGDGSAGPCPCGNQSAAGSGQGCVTTTGAGMTIAGSGSASASADDLVLTSTGVPRFNQGIFYVGDTLVGPNFLFDGLQCASGFTIRFQGQNSGASGLVTDTGFVGQSPVGRLFFNPGKTVYFQYFSRDNQAGPSPCGGSANLSPVLRVVVAP